MKPFFFTAICLIIYLVKVENIKAQFTIVSFDTIHLVQKQYYFEDFSLDDTLINKISIQKTAAVQMNDTKFKKGGNILGGLMTVATGIGFSSAAVVDWYLASSIRTSNPKLDWIFDVYCPGYIEKERTRVKNDDGSYSVETNYINKFSWEKGALGFIIEAGDTIGWSYVYRNPRTDTATQKWSHLVYTGIQEHSAIIYNEFALVGEFTGKKYGILFNSTENRIYIITSDEISGIYQCQKPPQLKLSKKKRKPFAQPYLLVNTRLTSWERMDILRLAMLGLRMKSAVESY